MPYNCQLFKLNNMEKVATRSLNFTVSALSIGSALLCFASDQTTGALISLAIGFAALIPLTAPNGWENNDALDAINNSQMRELLRDNQIGEAANLASRMHNHVNH